MAFSLNSYFRPTGTRFRLFPQTPVLEDFREPEVVYVSSPRGSLGPGPSDPRMYAQNPREKAPYGASELPPYLGPADAPTAPGPDGHFDRLDVEDPGFRAAHVFGAVRRVLDIWETYSGGPIHWHFGLTHKRLEIIPYVAWNNAQFGWGFMECGEGADDAGANRPFALNFDVLAHETGHGVLFSALGVPLPETLTSAYRGFHEAGSDCVAMISALHFDSFVDHVLKVSHGNLYLANEMNRIGELSRTRQIRSASNPLTMDDVPSLDTPANKLGGKEAHKLGLPIMGAIFDITIEFYLARLVAFHLIEDDFAETMRRAVTDDGVMDVDDSPIRAAYDREPEGFAQALCDARDMTGLRLAETFHRLSAHHLSYKGVANAFLSVDQMMTGPTHQDMVFDCFRWRKILTEADRPQSMAHRRPLM